MRRTHYQSKGENKFNAKLAKYESPYEVLRVLSRYRMNFNCDQILNCVLGMEREVATKGRRLKAFAFVLTPVVLTPRTRRGMPSGPKWPQMDGSFS